MPPSPGRCSAPPPHPGTQPPGPPPLPSPPSLPPPPPHCCSRCHGNGSRLLASSPPPPLPPRVLPPLRLPRARPRARCGGRAGGRGGGREAGIGVGGGGGRGDTPGALARSARSGLRFRRRERCRVSCGRGAPPVPAPGSGLACGRSQRRRHHGQHLWEPAEEPDRKEGDADPDGGAGRRREDHHPLQAEAGGDRHHHPHHRVQRGDGGVQEHQLHRVGRGWAGQDPTPLAALLPKHPGADLRGGQQRPGAGERGAGGADADAGRGRAAGRRPPRLRQQAGPAQRHERGGDHGQAGAAFPAPPQLVHPGHLCHQRGRALRGPRLARQPAQEQEVSGRPPAPAPTPYPRPTPPGLCQAPPGCPLPAPVGFCFLLAPVAVGFFAFFWGLLGSPRISCVRAWKYSYI